MKKCPKWKVSRSWCHGRSNFCVPYCELKHCEILSLYAIVPVMSLNINVYHTLIVTPFLHRRPRFVPRTFRGKFIGQSGNGTGLSPRNSVLSHQLSIHQSSIFINLSTRGRATCPLVGSVPLWLRSLTPLRE